VEEIPSFWDPKRTYNVKIADSKVQSFCKEAGSYLDSQETTINFFFWNRKLYYRTSVKSLTVMTVTIASVESVTVMTVTIASVESVTVMTVTIASVGSVTVMTVTIAVVLAVTSRNLIAINCWD
jgi:uncharacterized membrane protein